MQPFVALGDLMEHADKPGARRPGGRTARTRVAVLDAALTELISAGYDQISVERIAKRAGVHKTTIYRRWRTTDALVVEALEALAERRIAIPDTGTIDDDLRALARSVLGSLTSDEGAGALYALISGARHSPEVARIGRRFWQTRLLQVEPIIERAVERGQLPHGTNAPAIIEQVAAPLYFRLLITAKPLTEDAADQAAAAALAAARTGVFQTESG